jgi:hypothetical protein
MIIDDHQAQRYSQPHQMMFSSIHTKEIQAEKRTVRFMIAGLRGVNIQSAT